MSDVSNEKINEIPELLKDYLESFEEKSNDLDKAILDLQDDIANIKNDIKENEKKLKEKISEIDSKKKQVNVRLHGVSGDYNADDLIEAADILKKLTEEKTSLEKDINEQTTNLSIKLEELQNKKKNTSSVKNKVDNLKDETTYKLKNAYNENIKKLDAINTALELCNNDNLKRALEEEKEQMQDSLDKIFVQSQKQLGEEIDLLNDNKRDNFGNIQFNDLKPEVEETIEIENPEPNFSEIKEDEIQDLEDTDVINLESINMDKSEDVVPLSTFEKEKEKYDESREIIAKVDASSKAELVKGSQQVRKSLEKFFNNREGE